MNGKRLSKALWIILLGLIPLTAPAADLVDKSDVRVLIDISGSMKHNDPKNLRRPALRLLVGLLPKGTRAGVWTFASSANMQIPLAQVTDAWRAKARASSYKIGSPGQFTDIERALSHATQGWQGPPTRLRRSVVLLTDGMVDVAKDDAKNLASRQRILDKLIPRLQKLGAVVHTIALSKHADHELMRELAEATQGWYEQVDDAAQLQKVFLRIFEKVSRPDTLPLQDNRFTVDNSVTEATVLVFRQPDAKAARLMTPDGKTYDPETAPSSIVWHQDAGYDMLTIKKPRAGEWQILAEVDPDNRVIVVTDLRMHATALPNRVIHGQSLPVEVSFTEHGRLIRKPAFLNVLNVSAIQRDITGISDKRPALDNGEGSDSMAGDGLFTLELKRESLHRGVGELVITANGQTFTREKRMTYEVVPPVVVKATPKEQGDQLQVSMHPDELLVDVAALRTSIWLEDDQGKQFPLETSLGKDGVSRGSIDLMAFSGIRRIFVQANGKTKSGAGLKYLDSPIEVEGLLPPADPVQLEPAAEALPDKQTTANQKGASDQLRHEPLEWGPTLLWFGLLNLILLSLGGGVFWWWRKQSKLQLVELMDDEGSTAQHAPEAQAV
jgi:uncharacterized protein (TIGR03503 family)